MSVFNTAQAVAMGVSVSTHTGKLADGGTAAGYALWVQSIANTLPSLQKLPDNRAKIYLSEEQKKLMRSWVQTQIKKSLTDKTPPSLETDIGSVISGAGSSWGIIGAALLFVAGAIGMKGFESI